MTMSHHTPTNGTCYVRGCGDAPVLCANHKSLGLVATCSSHNPIRHAYDRPLPLAPAIAAPPAPEPKTRDERRRGGPKVRLTPPPTPPRPPAAAVTPF